ncbi:MAG: cytochrome c [Vicinamibacterales bacterium]
MPASHTRLFRALLGAALLVSVGAPAVAQTSAAPTFTKDVAPILQRSCQSCHRPGMMAPMSLLTYQDARPWARSIKNKVASREMPPWHIDRNVGIRKFKNDPSLSDKEVETIVKWVDAGAPQGNPADMPKPVDFGTLDTWHIKADKVVKMPKPYRLKAHGSDDFVDVTIDPGFTEDFFVSAIETRPINMAGYKVIHHATTNLIEDEDDPSGMFLNEYAIGKAADVFPPDSGRLIRAGSKLNFNLHLTPDGEEKDVDVQIAFTVLKKEPKYVAFTQHMGDVNDLDIPPNQAVRNDGYFRLPRPALISAFQPHMHMRGKAQCMEAIYPDIRADSARPGPARTEMLSCVSDFNFDWSITYPYADDVAPLLPAGTIIHIISWHDNTASNKHNPNPDTWLGYGPTSIDEMNFAWVTLTYLDQADFDRKVQERQAAERRTQQQQ